MDLPRRTYSTFPTDRERQTADVNKRKWPASFWFILKVLGLFYHKSLVTERKCFRCHVSRITKDISLGKVNKTELHLDTLNLAYELNSTEILRSGDDNTPVNGNGNSDKQCDVCKTLWWNSKRLSIKYTDREIGASLWNHRGSAVISTLILLTAISMLLYDLALFLPKLFGESDQILHLLIMLTLFIMLFVHHVMCLCSKLRSHFKSEVNRFCWATTLNARYLVKRAQVLDLQEKGLPGLWFFFACTLSPLALMTYRCIIFISLSDCEMNLYRISHSLLGVVLSESWGLFVYLLFFVRVSFQNQFNLLIGYIKQFEGDLERCRGTLYDVLSDFNCYKQLCNLYTSLMFPVFVLAVVANLTWNYLVRESCMVNAQPTSMTIQMHIMILAWSEIAVSVFMYAKALGGFKVEYIWENFLENLLLLRSDTYTQFWKELRRDDYQCIVKASNVVFASMICSVVGIYIAFNFHDQSVTFLTITCNITSNATNYCV